MPGDNLPTARTLWAKITAHSSTEGDLPALLLALHKKWTPGSLAAEFARALLAEKDSPEQDPEPEPLVLADITELPKTTRIDGVLPLTIPAPGEIIWASTELLEEGLRLKLGAPKDIDRFHEEIALAYFALLHRRPITSTHSLAITANLASPSAALLLLGKLPLGGTVTLFTSSLRATERCLFEPSAVEHLSRLKLVRTESGQLRIAEGTPRIAKRKDKWTFRL